MQSPKKPARSILSRRNAAILVATTFAAAIIALALAHSVWPDATPWPGRGAKDEVRADGRDEVIRAACSACHEYAPPEILPRAAWPHTIRNMYRNAESSGVSMPLTSEEMTAWYSQRAPVRLPPAPGRTDAGPGAVAWERVDWRPPGAAQEPDASPAIGHVQAVRLFDGPGDDLIVSDLVHDRVYAIRPYAPGAPTVVLGSVAGPTRVAAADLDADGQRDLVVAGLGRMLPTDDRVGRIVWLRRTGGERFEEVTLVEGLGRVGDVRAADINGDGRMDLVVAVFGWRTNGGVVWLENAGEEGGIPRFVQHWLDERPGFTDVRAVDLNGDGRLDVVALLCHGQQQVVVYWADGDRFRAEAVHRAPHPDWGYSGLEIVDFTGNGRPDIIVTNGDGLDVTVAKPDHGVGLVENLGGGRFQYHHLTHMYGAYRAEPVDLTGEGRIGLLVSAYLPAHLNFGHPDPAEAIVWLERVGPTQLVRRVLKAEGPHHMTLGAGDLTGDGREDFAVGWMDLGFADTLQAHRGEPLRHWVTWWRNAGTPASPGGRSTVDTIDWARPR